MEVGRSLLCRESLLRICVALIKQCGKAESEHIFLLSVPLAYFFSQFLVRWQCLFLEEASKG